MRSGDEATKNKQIAAAQLESRRRAAQFPNALSKAQVVLRRGISPAELQSALGGRSIELLAVEAKIPVPNSSEVYTVGLQGAALEETSGDVATRVRAGLSTIQAQFNQLATADAKSRAKYAALARGTLPIYSFEIVGTNADLAALGDAPDVRVVQPLYSEDPGNEVKAQRALRKSLQQERALISTGSISLNAR